MRTPPRRSVSSDCVAFGVRIRGARNDSEVAELSAFVTFAGARIDLLRRTARIVTRS